MAQALEVISKSGAFRRAGREFQPAPTVVMLDELTKEQVQALKDEPRLIVREVDVKPEGGKKPA